MMKIWEKSEENLNQKNFTLVNTRTQPERFSATYFVQQYFFYFSIPVKRRFSREEAL